MHMFMPVTLLKELSQSDSHEARDRFIILSFYSFHAVCSTLRSE